MDPGIINIVTATECTKEGVEYGKPWTFRQAEYYHLIKNDKSIAEARRWTAGLTNAYAQLQQYPRLTSDLVAFQNYLAVWRQPGVFDAIMAEMRKPRWREAYLRRYSLKQSALMSFFSAMREGRAADGTLGQREVTLVFGAAAFRAAGRGYRASPTVAVKRAAIAIFGRANVFLENEYFTSQKHAACGEKMLNVWTAEAPSRRLRQAHQARVDRYEHYVATQQHAVDPAAAAEGIVPGGGRLAPRAPWPMPRSREVRGLRYCNCHGCPDAGRRLVDRDVNASRCIRLAFLARVYGDPRPAFLCRAVAPAAAAVGAQQPQPAPPPRVRAPLFWLC